MELAVLLSHCDCIVLTDSKTMGLNVSIYSIRVIFPTMPLVTRKSSTLLTEPEGSRQLTLTPATLHDSEILPFTLHFHT
jgi:hypothetical protein